MGLSREFKLTATVERLNRIIHRSRPATNFVTLFLAEIDLNGAVTYCNAAVHTPESPEVDARYHLRHDGGWIFVDIATGATSEEQEWTNRTKAATPSPSPGTIRAR